MSKTAEKTDGKWQCPECKGHWPDTDDYCTFCKVIYGQHIPKDRQRTVPHA